MTSTRDGVRAARTMALLVAGCLLLGAWAERRPSSRAAEATTVAEPFDLSEYRPDPLVTELHLSATGGSCAGSGSSLDHVDVQETEAAVTVTVFLHVDDPQPRIWTVDPKHFYGCAAVGTLIEVPVRLSQPLGMREILDGACNPPVYWQNAGRCQRPPPKPRDPQVGHWKAVDSGPLATRGEPKAVWTGTEVIVVGGLLIDQYRALSDGAAFDPATGTWRRIANRPASGRVLHAVWTGTELFTYGSDGIGLETLTTGFAYNPATDRWRQIPLPPSAKVPHDVVWTGDRVLAWQPGSAVPGALFDPATNRWSPIPANSVPGAVSVGAAVWTGRELAVEGAVTPERGGPVEPRLFLFDPERQAWRVSSGPLARLDSWPFLIPGSAGGRVVITGTPPIGLDPSPAEREAKPSTLVYEPADDSWRSLPGPVDSGPLPPAMAAVEASEGSILVQGTGPLHILDVEAGRWSTSGPPPGPPPGDGAVVSTGKGVLAFGISTNGPYVRPQEPNAAYFWTP